MVGGIDQALRDVAVNAGEGDVEASGQRANATGGAQIDLHINNRLDSDSSSCRDELDDAPASISLFALFIT